MSDRSHQLHWNPSLHPFLFYFYFPVYLLHFYFLFFNFFFYVFSPSSYISYFDFSLTLSFLFPLSGFSRFFIRLFVEIGLLMRLVGFIKIKHKHILRAHVRLTLRLGIGLSLNNLDLGLAQDKPILSPSLVRIKRCGRWYSWQLFGWLYLLWIKLHGYKCKLHCPTWVWCVLLSKQRKIGLKDLTVTTIYKYI